MAKLNWENAGVAELNATQRFVLKCFENNGYLTFEQVCSYADGIFSVRAVRDAFRQLYVAGIIKREGDGWHGVEPVYGITKQ